MMRRWKPRALRFRLALWYAVGGTVLLALFSASLYAFVARRMAGPLGQELKLDLEAIRARLVVGADRRIVWDGVELPPDQPWDSRDPWFELWDENGRLVRRCWPFTESRLNRVPNPPHHGFDTLSIFRIAPDIPLRVYSTPYREPGGRDWMIRVMRIDVPATTALGSLLGIIVVSLPIVVALLVVGGYLVTRHWLKPLEQMVQRTEELTAGNRGRRLPVTDPADELGRLGAAFNQTLERFEDSYGTLERFVADASHELRTPLTTLRNVGEVGLRRSRTPEEYQEIIGSMLEEAQRLQQLVERLLELARVEGGARAVHPERMRLDEFVRTCVAEIGVLAEHRNQRIVVDTVPCEVVSDPLLLHQALQNLVDNATKYSPAGTAITAGVRWEGAECRISVTDEGPGLPPAHLAQLANRFYRIDTSRAREPGGFGLGLAITKAYMHALGGRLECANAVPHGSRFSLVLPAAARRGP